MDVSIDRETAKELISFKLHHLQELFQSILNKWCENNADDFISKAKSGLLKNGEMDAISIRQLLANYQKFKELHDSISTD